MDASAAVRFVRDFVQSGKPVASICHGPELSSRPGRALLGLSKLLVGAFGTAAFALTTHTIWQTGDALGGLRLVVIMHPEPGGWRGPPEIALRNRVPGGPRRTPPPLERSSGPTPPAGVTAEPAPQCWCRVGQAQ